jgi:sugar-specific transcriptional regulator TrmB
MVQNADIKLFVWLGLTEVQAKIYLTLLEIGETGAEVLSKQTKTPQPEVQSALKVLLKLGIVQEATTNNPPFLVTQQTRKKEKNGPE